jgi:hypothetical protein
VAANSNLNLGHGGSPGGAGSLVSFGQRRAGSVPTRKEAGTGAWKARAGAGLMPLEWARVRVR